MDRDLNLVLCSRCDLWLYWQPMLDELLREETLAVMLAPTWRAVTILEGKCRHEPKWEAA